MKILMIVGLAFLLSLLSLQAKAEELQTARVEQNFMDEFEPGTESAETILKLLEAEGFIEDISEDPSVYKAAFECAHPLQIRVSRSEQRLYLYEDCGKTLMDVWKVSTGVSGRSTPPFQGNPTGRMERRHYSSSKYPGGGCSGYGNMAYAVFYTHTGYAIHGTCSEGRLGKRASHGCVRVKRANAKYLQHLVRSYGVRNTLIVIN